MSFEPIPQVDEEVAHKIIGAAIEVHRHLGPGFLESVYHKAMHYELGKYGLTVETEKEILVPYKDIFIEGQRLDLLVGARIIVELKAVDKLAGIHEAQVPLLLEGNRTSTGTPHQLQCPSLERWRETPCPLNMQQ